MRPSLHNKFAELLRASNHQNDDVKTAWQSRCREQARIHRQRLAVCRTLTRYQAAAASMEDLGTELRNAAEGTRSEVDHRRLNTLGDIVSSALAFCRASDFEERERNFWQVTTQADRFREEVIETPTQYSHEGLLPNRRSPQLTDWKKSTLRWLGHLAQNCTSNCWWMSNLRGQEGEIRLQIEVSNKRGCSPASSLRICLGPRDSEYFVAEHWEREVVLDSKRGQHGGHTDGNPPEGHGPGRSCISH